MNYPAAELRGIRCHAGLDKPAPAFSKPGASSLVFWIPAFAGMTTHRPACGILQRRINLRCAPTSDGELNLKRLILRDLTCQNPEFFALLLKVPHYRIKFVLYI